MNFVCAYDAKGFYWRFSHPSGALYKEKTKIAVLNPDWSITTLKGVVLKASISANAPRSNARDLQDALFTAIPHTKGLFEGIRYIERRHATGGLPLTRCSASQLGQRLARPFEAQYVFWR